MPEQSISQDSTVIRRILEERAAVLARPPQITAADNMAELVVAVVRGERFGVPIARVREIQALGVTLPHVPGLPAYWVGLMNLRGRLYPVLDLGSYLGLPIPDRRKAEPVLSQVEGGGSAQTRRNEADAHTSKIILVSAIGLDVGLLVDDVPGVRQLAQAEIGPPLMEIGGGKRPIIAGVTSDLLSVLDLEALLSDPRLIGQEELGELLGGKI